MYQVFKYPLTTTAPVQDGWHYVCSYLGWATIGVHPEVLPGLPGVDQRKATQTTCTICALAGKEAENCINKVFKACTKILQNLRA